MGVAAVIAYRVLSALHFSLHSALVQVYAHVL